MKYSLRILKNKNLSKRLKYPSPNELSIKYFWHSATIIGGFRVSLNYPILNFKKTVCPKNVWIGYCWCTLILFLHVFLNTITYQNNLWKQCDDFFKQVFQSTDKKINETMQWFSGPNIYAKFTNTSYCELNWVTAWIVFYKQPSC